MRRNALLTELDHWNFIADEIRVFVIFETSMLAARPPCPPGYHPGKERCFTLLWLGEGNYVSTGTIKKSISLSRLHLPIEMKMCLISD